MSNTSAIFCTDTDQGINIYTKGSGYSDYLNGTRRKGNDTCITHSGFNVVVEVYCNANLDLVAHAIDCPNRYSCSNGACLVETRSTTSIPYIPSTSIPSILNVSISNPIDFQVDFQVVSLRKIFSIISKVTCQQNNCAEVFATPRYNSTGLFPITPINSTNGENPLSIAISRYVKSIWNRTYNPAVKDASYGVTIDTNNNIYAVGYQTDTDANWHIMKLDSNGASIWNRTYNPGTTDKAFGVAIDSSNNIYAVGYRTDADLDWFIMKINATGNSIWNRTYNPGTTDAAQGVAIDSSNNIYVVGYRVVLDLDLDWVIMKINATGNSIWNRTYNPTVADAALGVAIDSSNNIYAVGQSRDTDVNWVIMKLENSRNYQTCGTLNVGQSCVFDWQINATSPGAYRIGVYYNSTTAGLFKVTENRTVIV